MSNSERLQKQTSDLTSSLRESGQQTRHCLVPLALALVLLQPIFGQTGNSSGTVSDPFQAVIADAVVTLSDPSTGFHRQTKTEETGYYKFPDLQPGTYVIKVTQTGFGAFATSEFQLLVSQDLSLPVKLTVGSESQQVTVASAPPLDTESAAYWTGGRVKSDPQPPTERKGLSAVGIAQRGYPSDAYPFNRKLSKLCVLCFRSSKQLSICQRRTREWHKLSA